MDGIISFFRDTLDGPLYIATVVLCVILLFACVGYLAERKIKGKKEKEKYATVPEGAGPNVVAQDFATQVVNPAQVAPVSMPVSENQTILQPQMTQEQYQAPIAAPVVPQEVAPIVNEVPQQTIVTPVSEVNISSPTVANTNPTALYQSENQQNIAPVQDVLQQSPVTATTPQVPIQQVETPQINVAEATPVVPEFQQTAPVQPVVEVPQPTPVPVQNVQEQAPTIPTIAPQMSQPAPIQQEPVQPVVNEQPMAQPVQSQMPTSSVIAIPVVKVPSVEPVATEKQ